MDQIAQTFKTPAGLRIRGYSFYSNEFLQLNHYYSKSHDEMRAKIRRGSNYAASAQRLQEKMETTVGNIEADMVEDRSMIDFLKRISVVL